MDETLLTASKLRKEFPVLTGLFRRQTGSVLAVDNVSFTLKRGETLGIAGESGCGKSTLARLLLRLTPPTSGDVTLHLKEGDIDWFQLEEKKLRQMRPVMQMVFQHPLLSLNPRKTIGELLSTPLRLHTTTASEEELKGKVLETLQQVGLSREAYSRYPHAFSGGQLQRICIARALLMDPQVIICDEAVSALDLSVQAQILNLLQDVQEARKLSYLFIAHDLGVVRAFCDRAIILHHGKIVEQGAVEEIFENPQASYTKALLAAIPKQKKSLSAL